MNPRGECGAYKKSLKGVSSNERLIPTGPNSVRLGNSAPTPTRPSSSSLVLARLRCPLNMPWLRLRAGESDGHPRLKMATSGLGSIRIFVDNETFRSDCELPFGQIYWSYEPRRSGIKYAVMLLKVAAPTGWRLRRGGGLVAGGGGELQGCDSNPSHATGRNSCKTNCASTLNSRSTRTRF